MKKRELILTAVVTLLLSGGSLADSKAKLEAKPQDPSRSEKSACDCHLDKEDER